MKKINYLGVNNRVPRCLESIPSLPPTDLAGQATLPRPLQLLNNLCGQGGQPL
jgi:hypothetical protein